MLLDFDLQTYSKHTIKMSSVSTRKLNFELWLISWHFVNEIQAFWLKNRLWRQFLKLWSKVIEKVFRFSIAINLTEVRFLFLRWNHSFFFLKFRDKNILFQMSHETIFISQMARWLKFRERSWVLHRNADKNWMKSFYVAGKNIFKNNEIHLLGKNEKIKLKRQNTEEPLNLNLDLSLIGSDILERTFKI